MGMMLLQVGLQALVGGGSSEFVDLTVEIVRNDGQRATVRAVGKLRTTALSVQMVNPFEEEIPLVRKGRQWYVSGEP